MLSKSYLSLIWAAVALAAPVSLPPNLGPLTIFETLAELPTFWETQGAAPQDASLLVQIGLKQSNIQGLQAKLLDISNPTSANYGKWLSQKEVDSYVVPPAANVALVKTWLALFNITGVSQPTSDWIQFSAPVSVVEPLLGAKYSLFKNTKDNSVAARTMQFSVPLLLHPFIDLITPTTAFYTNLQPTIESTGSNEEERSLERRATCNTSSITPACINSLYNVDYTSKGQALVGATAFIQVGASHSDYSTFASKFKPGLKDFKDVSVSGGSNPGSGSLNTLLEGNLDTQYIGSVSSPNPSEFLAVGPNNQDFTDQIANFASYLTSTSTPPTSVSTSYGGEEQTFSSSYLTRVCNEFMKAGSLGISVFFSSGDHGVGGNGESSCSNGFYALWPAACPWITSVGGTQFNGTTEVVASFSSVKGSPGGGFSNVFSTPSYQTSDVSSYIKGLGSQYSGKYNANGRGYPDIALVAINFQVIVNNQQYSVLGTSASSPSWAALVSVLNDYRKSNGKANLGFINTLLYSTNGRTALRDITAGSNVGCDSQGFPAKAGWDAASGLGSLDFAKLRAQL